MTETVRGRKAQPIVRTPRSVLLLVEGMTAVIGAITASAANSVPGGTRGDPNMNHPALSFDSPDVLAVVFHPRPEGAVLAGSFENLTVPVGDGVTRKSASTRGLR